MERLITIHTSSEDFTDKYTGKYFDYFQIHIYSVSEIISSYYNPKHTNLETVKSAAENLLNQIKKNSNSQSNKITMFEKNGKFLICEDLELFDDGELFYFDKQRIRYEYDYEDNFNDIDKFLGDRKVEVFIKKSLISIGASDLYEIIEPIALQKKLRNDKYLALCEEDRILNLSNPKYILEIYRIERDYKPVLINTFKLHNQDAMDLPEFKSIIQSDERITYLIKDIATGKIIDGDLEEDIESLKHSKWQKKHPSVIDFDDLQRMELDDNDPNFLSWDDYVADDDETEEGDEDYQPRF
ncbi:hypothetical protein ACSVH2_08575 [Flavobacterium sp. RSB2_4_14]|uniref:hypothetical protein n=1 Tax=Flavobacterium sp. RSB2_4_14 TaxID=3447665 RepID=UPI003F4104C5